MRINNLHNNDLNFKRGLTTQMRSEIRATRPLKISEEFKKRGVVTDFKENKIIAWCCWKCLKLTDELNKKCHFKQSLPNGIFVENLDEKDTLGFTNIFASKKVLPNDREVPARCILFNQYNEENYDNGKNKFWDNIDELSDKYFEDHKFATDSFMEPFIHEFSHLFHINHLSKKLSNIQFLVNLSQLNDPGFIAQFEKEFGSFLKTYLCEYAKESPYEATAFHLSKEIIRNINPNTLLPERNIFNKTPYDNRFSFFKKIFDTELEQMFRNFWEGKIY